MTFEERIQAVLLDIAEECSTARATTKRNRERLEAVRILMAHGELQVDFPDR